MKILRKIKNGFISFIDENIKELLFIFGAYIVITYPLPYYILTSGGTIAVDDRVEIEEEYKQEGSFNLAYVDQLEATLPTYIIAKFNKSWTIYSANDFKYDEKENANDIDFRDNMELKDSMQSSVFVAYKEANREITINDIHNYIYYVDQPIKDSGLLVGDEIISINDIEIKDLDDLRDEINKYEVGDTVSIKYKRKKKENEVELKIREEKGKKIVGLMIMTIFDYETNPKIKFNFSSKEGGSSGGLTLALAIYNKLTEEDITHGYKIVGTGTIDKDGNVGEIGGIKYKLKGAVKSKADIFIVPNDDNYKEALKEKEKHNYKINIIGVDTFSDAIQALEELKK